MTRYFGRPTIYTPASAILARMAGGFTKGAGNPVLAIGAGGAWDNGGVRELCPVTDELGAVVTIGGVIPAYYGGVLAGVAKIGRATSADNGLTWTKYGSNPVIVPTGTGWYSTAGQFVFQPSVIQRLDGTFVMMAAGRDTSGNDGVGCLTSTDGLTWTDAGGKFTLSTFTDGATATVEIGVPNLLKLASGNWLCLLEGRTSGITNGWRIYGATASDPTGSWTPLNSAHPLISAISTTSGAWESIGVANPHAIETQPGELLIQYNGISTGAIWQVGFLTLTNLTTVSRYGSNPVLSWGAGGSWDAAGVEACFLFREPFTSTVRMLYQGYNAGGVPQVGYAST